MMIDVQFFQAWVGLEVDEFQQAGYNPCNRCNKVVEGKMRNDIKRNKQRMRGIQQQLEDNYCMSSLKKRY